jgi:peptidyl-prolyl cis-trans isomerase C
MAISIQDITVNGVAITDEQINTEMQYHPAPAMLDARYQAMRALVVRELLVQRAAKLGIKSDNIDDMVDAILQKEVSVPKMSDEECERYYNNNKARFHTSPLFEVAHILYLAPTG